MPLDTPTARLSSVVTLLTGRRALGPAARTREGSAPYSMELDFQTADQRAVRQAIAWASDQAPYAKIELVSSSVGALVTIFVQIDVCRLAVFLAGQAYLQSTGELWDPKNDPLPALVQHVIDETVGSAESWAELQSQLAAVGQSFAMIEQAVAGGDQQA
jgi:hypothetical protein